MTGCTSDTYHFTQFDETIVIENGEYDDYTYISWSFAHALECANCGFRFNLLHLSTETNYDWVSIMSETGLSIAKFSGSLDWLSLRGCLEADAYWDANWNVDVQMSNSYVSFSSDSSVHSGFSGFSMRVTLVDFDTVDSYVWATDYGCASGATEWAWAYGSGQVHTGYSDWGSYYYYYAYNSYWWIYLILVLPILIFVCCCVTKCKGQQKPQDVRVSKPIQMDVIRERTPPSFDNPSQMLNGMPSMGPPGPQFYPSSHPLTGGPMTNTNMPAGVAMGVPMGMPMGDAPPPQYPLTANNFASVEKPDPEAIAHAAMNPPGLGYGMSQQMMPMQGMSGYPMPLNPVYYGQPSASYYPQQPQGEGNWQCTVCYCYNVAVMANCATCGSVRPIAI